MERLSGKVAVVTGAAQGIGRGVAEKFAAEGASVVVADIQGAEQAAEEIAAAGGAAIGVSGDISDRADVIATFDAAEEAFGTVTALVTAAGISRGGTAETFLELGDDEWDRVMAVNLRGTFIPSQVAAQRMVAADVDGAIVTVASVGAYKPMIGAPAYHASKGGVISLTRALAVNLAHHGIRANSIAPGYIVTEMFKPLLSYEEGKQTLLSRIPQRRFGQPADIADVAAFLAGDEAAYVTGEIIRVDGGYVVQGWGPSVEPTRPLPPEYDV